VGEITCQPGPMEKGIPGVRRVGGKLKGGQMRTKVREESLCQRAGVGQQSRRENGKCVVEKEKGGTFLGIGLGEGNCRSYREGTAPNPGHQGSEKSGRSTRAARARRRKRKHSDEGSSDGMGKEGQLLGPGGSATRKEKEAGLGVHPDRKGGQRIPC